MLSFLRIHMWSRNERSHNLWSRALPMRGTSYIDDPLVAHRRPAALDHLPGRLPLVQRFPAEKHCAWCWLKVLWSLSLSDRVFQRPARIAAEILTGSLNVIVVHLKCSVVPQWNCVSPHVAFPRVLYILDAQP